MTAFDTKSRTFRHRSEIAVSLRLKDSDEEIPATIFAGQGERPLDMLNDERAFIPVRRPSGDVMLVAKTQIASLTERKDENEKAEASGRQEEEFSQEPIKEAAQNSFDPYAMLRVSPEASPEEIRAAYKARIKAVHPDALAFLDLDEDIKKAAILAAQKVNYAYQKIMRERGGSGAERVA